MTELQKELHDTAHGEDSILARVMKQLARKYTMLRRSGIERLLHCILNKIIENIQPISLMYRVQLEWYETVLERTEAKFKKKHVQSLLRIKRELARLTGTLTPMQTLLSTLVHSQVFKDCTYIQDCLDDVTTILFDLRACTELVHELSASFDHFRERRQERIVP